MKKILLSAILLASASLFAQTHSTNEIPLTSGFSVQFDTDPTLVTMTMKGPENTGFAIGIGMTSMFTAGADCAFVSGSTVANATLTDRRFNGNSTQPALDATNNWTIVSNTVANGTRTIVATRPLNTGDTAGGDYVFTNSPSSIDLIWAIGSTISFNSHNNRGNGVTGNFTLASDSFALAGFKMYPNPASDVFAIELPSGIDNVTVQIFDVLGKEVLVKNISALQNKINTSGFNSGNYIVKVISEDKIYSTKLIID